MSPRSLAAAALFLCVASPAHAFDLRTMVSDIAQRFGVPAKLANGVAHVETGHRCGAIGSLGERGPMQIRPGTARGLGYTGSTAALSDCRVGTTWSMLYLRQALDSAGGDWGLAVTRYNAGLHTRRRSSAYATKVLAAAR